MKAKKPIIGEKPIDGEKDDIIDLTSDANNVGRFASMKRGLAANKKVAAVKEESPEILVSDSEPEDGPGRHA